MKAVLSVLSLVYCIWLLACAAPGQVAVTRPQGRGGDYPFVIENSPERQQEVETVWRTFLADFQLPETKLETEPVLNTPRTLPTSLAGKINVHTKNGVFDELAAKD